MSEPTPSKSGRRSEWIGKYEIREYIARGGMGAVYKAFDSEHERIVALKILPPDLAEQPMMLERFRREALASQQLRHENIVALYDCGILEGTNYLALEFVEGVDLEDLLKKKQKLKPEEARQIVVQAARGLEHLYFVGIVHRDIKPSNFLLTLKERKLVVKIADLGLALHTSDDEFRITKAGTTVGTVDYMAPEQARKSDSADVRSDIYSLGCTFYHMLAGVAPFPEGSLAERIIQHMEAEPPDVRRFNADVPDSINRILKKMLAKKPEDRFQTPADLVRDLEQAAPLRKKSKRPGLLPLPDQSRTHQDDVTDELDVSALPPSADRTRPLTPIPVEPPAEFVEEVARAIPFAQRSEDIEPPPPKPRSKTARRKPDEPERFEIVGEIPVTKAKPKRTIRVAEEAIEAVEVIDDEPHIPPKLPSRLGEESLEAIEVIDEEPVGKPKFPTRMAEESLEAIEVVDEEEAAPKTKVKRPTLRPEDLAVLDAVDDKPKREKARKTTARTEYVEAEDAEEEVPKKDKPRKTVAKEVPLLEESGAEETPVKPKERKVPVVAAEAEEIEEEAPSERKKPRLYGTETVKVVEVDESGLPKPKAKGIKIPGLGMVAIAGGGLVVLLVIIALFGSPRTPVVAVNPNPDPNPPLTPVVVQSKVIEDKKKDETVDVVQSTEGKKDPLVKVPGASGGPMGPTFAGLPQIIPIPPKMNREEILKEFMGAWGPFPEPGNSATVMKVASTAGKSAGWFGSLGEALKAGEGVRETVIEIHDQGPFFIESLPPVKDRRVHVRAGPGYRPLVVWEVSPAAAKESGLVFLPVSKGKLILENLDLAARWSAPAKAGPAVVFDLEESEFQALSCTFSIGSKHPQGVELVRLRSKPGRTATLSPAQCRFQRCFARGGDLVVLKVESTPAEILLDRSLFAAHLTTPVQLRPREQDEIKLRISRSTLVTSQNLFKITPGDAGKLPKVDFLTLDSIFARNDASAPVGDMLRIDGGVELSAIRWQAVGALYPGWKRLLVAGAIGIDSQDPAAWRAQWAYPGSEGSPLETWPNCATGQLDDTPISTFSPFESASVLSQGFVFDGIVGAGPGSLAPEPSGWIERTFERPSALVAFPGDELALPPLLETDADGLYTGEKIDLKLLKTDLGLYLQSKLLPGRVSKRVALHLVGKGVHYTGPIQIRGVEELLIYFEQPADPRLEPLSLEVLPRAFTGKANQAMFEIEGGHLKLIHARVRFENTKSAIVPRHMISVKDGDLTLYHCTLIGPFHRSPEAFQSLVAFSGSEDSQAPPNTFQWVDNVFISGKSLAGFTRPRVQLAARNNLGIALGAAFAIDLDPNRIHPGVRFTVDRNTWSVGQGLVSLRRPGGGSPTSRPILFQAVHNAIFADPFGEGTEPKPLLRDPDGALSRGVLSWHGKGNVIDKRLNPLFRGPEGSQANHLSDWFRLWGRAGEPDALVADLVKEVKTFNADAFLGPNAANQVRLFAVPATLRTPPPGADFSRLGLPRKKN